MKLLRVLLCCFLLSLSTAHAAKSTAPAVPSCKESPDWKTDGACQRSKAEDVGTLTSEECFEERDTTVFCTTTTTKANNTYTFLIRERSGWTIGQEVSFVTIVPATGKKDASIVTALCGPRYAYCINTALPLPKDAPPPVVVPQKAPKK